MKRILILLLTAIAFFAMASARECHYCKGTGKIVKYISGSRYGLDHETKVKCKECGEMHLPSSGHTHIHCKYCGGTGKLPDYGNSSSGSYASGSDEAYFDGPSVLDLDYNVMTLEAQQHVKTQYYGIPITQQERELMNRLSPNALKAYGQFREILNQGHIYASEAIQKNWASSMSSAQIVNYFNTMTEQINQVYNPMIATMQNQPGEIVTALEQLSKSRMKNIQELFEALHSLVQVANVANSLQYGF